MGGLTYDEFTRFQAIDQIIPRYNHVRAAEYKSHENHITLIWNVNHMKTIQRSSGRDGRILPEKSEIFPGYVPRYRR